jgi:3-deoxy-manno-octulosonate cytidylyltransferase (CMP-KDO synthetase)
MIVIPARIGSTRFPRKVLVEIEGVPIVVWTARRGAQVDRVVVATDSPEVLEVCKKFGIEGVLTSPTHRSGTDRVLEAVEKLGVSEGEVIINLQADEPFIEPEVLEAVKRGVESLNRQFKMVTCCRPIPPGEAQNPDIVKVVLDREGDALYFSRAPIPFHRERGEERYWGHLGIYGFDLPSLRRFVEMEGVLEQIEKLEQLRVLENREKIRVIPVESRAIGIDTPEDLERALFCLAIGELEL